MKARFFSISILLTLSIALAACASSTPNQIPVEQSQPATAESTAALEPIAEPVTLQFGSKCGPSPHAMPFFIVMAQTDGVLPGGAKIEFVPVTEPAQMTALLNSGEVDAMLGFIAQSANIYQKGGVSNLRMLDVLLWKGFYVVAPESVKSWEDLKGKTLLMPDPQGGPSQLAMTSMRQAGFDPETDFTIQSVPASEAVQLMVGGKGDAAILSEPFVTITLNKGKQQGVALIIAPIHLYDVYQAKAWESGQAPINGLLALQETLDDPALSAALIELRKLYIAAIEFMLTNPDEASKLIVGQLGEFCDSNMEAKPLSIAIQSGRMVYGVTPARDLLPDLDAYIEEITQIEIDDAFYAEH